MDALMKLSRDVQIVLGGAVLYVIFSFMDWQQVSAFGVTAGRSEWSGFGIIAALVAIVLLVWEVGRAIGFKIELGALTPGVVSAGLALLLLVFTVITFLTHDTARHWPAWVGLILSIAIAVAAFRRARSEGVEMPQVARSTGRMGGTGDSGSTTTTSASGDEVPPAPHV